MKTTFLVLLLLVAGIVIADTTSVAYKEPTTVVSHPDYELLYKNQLHYNDKILDTIYWSLGALLTVGLVMLGSNFYSAFKFNTEQINSLKKELTSKVSADVLESVNKSANTIKQDTEQLIKFFTENYQKQIDTIIGNVNEVDKRSLDASEIIKKKLYEAKSEDANQQALLYLKDKNYSSALDAIIELALFSMDIKVYAHRPLVYINRWLARLDSITEYQNEMILSIIDGYHPTSKIGTEALLKIKKAMRIKNVVEEEAPF